MKILFLFLITVFLAVVSCQPAYKSPDLAGLYNNLVQNENPYRNPVILIPGLLGSKLIDRQSQKMVWGHFGFEPYVANSGSSKKRIALPMQVGKPLSELTVDIVPAGALDRIIFNFLGYPLQQNTYAHILNVLGIGGYRDQDLAEARLIDYGDRHFTCFQFDYDWRRDIVENASVLDQFIAEKKRYVQKEIEKRFGIHDLDVKFDIVAHSMGGLIARYYLRYGSQDLPADGSLPVLNWVGSKHVQHVVMIGTPNMGSIDSLVSLVNGYRPAPLLTRYPPAVLGTMPSLYELLPRNRHRTVMDERGLPVSDLFDLKTWQRHEWGLADPKQERVLEWMLPEVRSPEERRRIALDHLEKSLGRARQFMAALDFQAQSPPSLRYFLVAGDSEKTPKSVSIQANGRLRTLETAPGDDVVIRTSALGDERLTVIPNSRNRLVSPIKWDQVLFLFSDHLDLTRDPAFTDNLLYFLLESQ